METAEAAMEKVPLLQSEDGIEKQTKAPDASAAAKPLAPPEEPVPYDAMMTDRPSFFDRFLLKVHSFFSRFCHVLGSLFLRMLSTVMLLTGIICGVILQLVAYYYTGVLNVWVLLACLFYAPTLVALAVIREEMLLHGVSRSGTGPQMSQFVTFAYLILMVSGMASVLEPLVLHGEHEISAKSMWVSIAGTAAFYYCLLVSEVLFGASLNIRSAHLHEEAAARDAAEPRWMARYLATQAGQK